MSDIKGFIKLPNFFMDGIQREVIAICKVIVRLGSKLIKHIIF